METINFDKTKFLQLKKLYLKAVREKQESFSMDGHELLTAYAKYVVEFLEMKFK